MTDFDPQESRLGYPGLSQLPREVQSFARHVFDRLNSLQGRAGDNPTFFRPTVHNGQRLTGVGDPTADQDAVTLAYANKHFGPTIIKEALQASGTTPLDVTGLHGTSSAGILVGTHADRLATDPTGVGEGVGFFENDRVAFYVRTTVSGTAIWGLISAAMVGSAAGRPSDLGSTEEGFIFYQQDPTEGNIAWYWSGASWHTILGRQQGTLAALPAPTTALVGLEYRATDFARVYRCTGAAWAEVTVSDQGLVAVFQNAPGVGWGRCDGSTYTLSTPTGGLSSLTTFDMVTNRLFFRTFSASGGANLNPVHSHQINPPPTASGGPSATITVDRNLTGATVSVPTASATYTTDIAPFQDQALVAIPPYWEGIPYVRL